MKKSPLLLSTKTMLATVAVTGLMAGSGVRLHASTNGKDDAQLGVGSLGQLADDSDKGKSSCKSKNNCKSDNSCKGKGGCKSSA